MIYLILPMPFGVALKMPPVELMNALWSDGAILFACQSRRDFLPCFPALALFADIFHKWFKPAVKGSPAAGMFPCRRLLVVDDFWIHQRRG